MFLKNATLSCWKIKCFFFSLFIDNYTIKLFTCFLWYLSAVKVPSTITIWCSPNPVNLPSTIIPTSSSKSSCVCHYRSYQKRSCSRQIHQYWTTFFVQITYCKSGFSLRFITPYWHLVSLWHLHKNSFSLIVPMLLETY